MLRKSLVILIFFIVITSSGDFALAACPSADLTGDCFVDFEDFSLMADQWLTTDPCVSDDTVYIPDGEFEMGDNLGDGESDELPVHTVSLDWFFMGRYKITNQQYSDYLNSAYYANEIKVDGGIVYASSDYSNSFPYCDTSDFNDFSQIECSGGVFSVRTKGGRDMANDPMVMVSWYGSAAYCNWRSQKEGYEPLYDPCDPNWHCDFAKKGYRLPTEAEWEYAARGGLSGKRFPWGDTISHSKANYYSLWEGGIPYYSYDVSLTEGHHPTWNDGIHPYTSPVDSFCANSYGVYGMGGNVLDWCNDWWASDYYNYSPTDNPTGPMSGTSRVIRGGCWAVVANHCRVADRHRSGSSGPGVRDRGLHGFRVVLDLN